MTDNALNWTRLHYLTIPHSFKGVLRRTVQLLNLLRNSLSFMNFIITLMHGQNRAVFMFQPEVVFKCLGPYLINDLTIHERLTIIEHHYRYYRHSLSFIPHQALAKSGVTIWSKLNGSNDFSIVLFHGDGFYLEGELVLSFFMDNDKIFNLAFTVTPGSLFHLTDEHVIIIGASQGKDGSSGQIRHAAKCNNEIAPPTMLLLALQSLAESLNIQTILGISVFGQISTKVHSNPEGHYSTYDELWKVNGGIKHSNYYLISSQINEKPIELVPRTHRSRAKQKRIQKHIFLKQVLSNIEHLKNPVASPRV